MKVLVVDDQVPVVQGILSGVNWDEIGVDLVRGAFSMQDAQDAFDFDEFDVAVCDIKMPFGSGIELVEWIREMHPRTEAIFLTSHAEFEYAQKAIKLGCFDYMIQPVEYGELQKCIRKALDKVCQGEADANLKAYGTHWQDSREELQKTFWRDALTRNNWGEDASITEAAKRVGLTIDDKASYLPVLLVCKQSNVMLDFMEEEIEGREAFQKAEPFIGIHADYELISVDRMQLVLLLKLMNPLEYERLISQMKLFVNVSKVQLGYLWECYVGETMHLTDLNEHFQKLNEMKTDNVLHLSDVFLAENKGKSPEIAGMDFGENWTQLFVNGGGEEVLEEAEQLIHKLSFDKKLNNRYLFAVFQKIMMSFYASLEMRKLDLELILKDAEYVELYQKASTPRDIDDVLNYIAYLAKRNSSLQAQEEDGTTIITQIQDYIAENIDKELSREEIAGRFFLSKDYISHLFKDKTGVSLIDYINTEKVKFAQHLLSTTNLPISIVSAKVGYSNFAYFSRVFKKYTDYTPNEYRKQHGN